MSNYNATCQNNLTSLKRPNTTNRPPYFHSEKTWSSMNWLLVVCLEEETSYLFAIMSWIIPCGYPIIVIHEKWPSSLWINFYFPTRRKRVVCGHRNHWRLRLHALRNPRSWILSHCHDFSDVLRNRFSDVQSRGCPSRMNSTMRDTYERSSWRGGESSRGVFSSVAVAQALILIRCQNISKPLVHRQGICIVKRVSGQ